MNQMNEIQSLKSIEFILGCWIPNLPENQVGGAPGPDRAVSDGYWVTLDPLSPGKHDIHFKVFD
jgi:hypothetical protein